MFRDDDAARAAYIAALERKAARVDELEARIRELETENGELRRHLGASSPPMRAPDGDVFVDDQIVAYVDALITATDPRRTEGILSGALASVGPELLAGAREHARAAKRPYVLPTDVREVARALLPRRILMQDPDADPAMIVRAILDVVDVP